MKSETVLKPKGALFSTKELVIISLFAGLSYVLQLIHPPYKHLGFLEFELSDVPAVIATLQYGPLAGILIELVKNLIKAITASTTAWVGEAANFLISCAYILPIGLINRFFIVRKSSLNGTERKKRKDYFNLVLMFGAGVITMAFIGALINYYIMIPLYAKIFGGMDNILGIASGYISSIKDLAGIVIIGITPFNIVKGIVISIVGYYTHRLIKGRLS